ncbi:hypothetical protein F2Q68_00044354 [Brassica cretica]|uniref:Uncharacterized protein n=1 Tax=Brassica cretica TaxID=69181 RepID=A0A8S9LKX9_BRACR|nr:hypothetical protein F2Q68_00044354 [Brassica cretica]
MSGNTKDKFAVRNNAGNTTPTVTAPMANAYANATVLEKIEILARDFSPQEVLKDKSTGPPREEDSTPQQRSPFLQGPVTGLRTLYPADECQSSLKHQQVHLRRTLHHWEKPTWVTRQESKSCRQLKYKIKLPNTTRSPSNRSRTWKYSLRPRSTIWKKDSLPGSNTVQA